MNDQAPNRCRTAKSMATGEQFWNTVISYRFETLLPPAVRPAPPRFLHRHLALVAVPLGRRRCLSEPDAPQVEPLPRAILVVAGHHLAIADPVAVAIPRLVPFLLAVLVNIRGLVVLFVLGLCRRPVGPLLMMVLAASPSAAAASGSPAERPKPGPPQAPPSSPCAPRPPRPVPRPALAPALLARAGPLRDGAAGATGVRQ